MTGPVFSEAEVIGRIDAFRRRRPRLKDEIITLAHGAGGKSSAALVDAVFVEAFGNELGDGAVLTAPGGSAWRCPPTRSWCNPCASPAARSATSPCTAP